MGGKSVRTKATVLPHDHRDSTRARARDHREHLNESTREETGSATSAPALPADRSLTPPSIVLFVDDSDESVAAFAALEEAELRFAAAPSPNGHAPYVDWMGTEIAGTSRIAAFAQRERTAKEERRELLDNTLPPAMRNVPADQQERARRIKEQERQAARHVLEEVRSTAS
ncbi:MAG: hypothetical protein ACRDJH_07820 [Thermomicrobiales bacterium]